MVICHPSLFSLSVYSSNGSKIRNTTLQSELGLARCMCFSEDGTFVCVAGDNGVVQVFKTFYLKPVYAYPAFDAVIRSIQTIPNSSHIAVGLANGKLALLNVNFNLFDALLRNKKSEEEIKDVKN
ncbi:hypothetical protein ACOME3_007638 [Neoechinorhynchus agilis]